VNLNIFCEEVPKPKITKSLILSFASFMAKEENVTFADVNIIFCSDEYLLGINKQYLQHDYYTDIITFDYNDNNLISSDIFISVDRLKDNAHTLQISFNSELMRIIIHGLLHLCGYEDDTTEKRSNMSLKEDYYLSQIK
jgi:probable rRNA maturation factor